VFLTCISNVEQQGKTCKQASNKHFSADNFLEQLLNTFLSLNLPFRALENIEFRKLVQMLRPGTQMPGRHRFGDLVQGRRHKIQQTLLHGLEPKTKVSIALDNWTSPNHLAFMGVTAYFIDDSWNY